MSAATSANAPIPTRASPTARLLIDQWPSCSRDGSDGVAGVTLLTGRATTNKPVRPGTSPGRQHGTRRYRHSPVRVTVRPIALLTSGCARVGGVDPIGGRTCENAGTAAYCAAGVFS